MIVFPFTGSGAEVGLVRQLRYRTDKSWAYINGVPADIEREVGPKHFKLWVALHTQAALATHSLFALGDVQVHLYCDWYAPDAAASAALRSEETAAEDAHLAAMPGADPTACVASLSQKETLRHPWHGSKVRYMVKWQGNHPSSLESDAHIKT